MEPTLRSGDFVLVSSLPYLLNTPKKGEVIAAKIKGKVFIKRITKVESKKYFLSGDNAHDSFDSRSLGLIARKQIIGKVIFPFILAS